MVVPVVDAYLIAPYDADNVSYQISSNTMPANGFNQVPTLNGANFQEWNKMFMAFCQTKDLANIIEGTSQQPDPNDDQSNKEAIQEWISKDMNTRGYLCLKVDATIAHLIKGKSAAEGYQALKDEFSKVSPTVIYTDFREAISLKFTGNEHPLPTINKMCMLFACLATNGVKLDDFIKAMILINAIPSKWEIIATMNLALDKESIKFESIIPDLIRRWDQQSKGSEVNKISAMKKKRGQIGRAHV